MLFFIGDVETNPSSSLKTSVRGAVVTAVGSNDREGFCLLPMPVDNGVAALRMSIGPKSEEFHGEANF
jgi:hypothetical protein